MKKVLIIEDDATFADGLKARLAGAFQVEVCADGQSGFYAIYEYKPDAVLLDLTIDQMDAVSLVGKMRVQKQFQKLPIILLADSKTVPRANDALAAGASEAFLKDEADALQAVAAAVTNLLTPSLLRKPAPLVDPLPMLQAAPALAAAARMVAAPAPAVSLPVGAVAGHISGSAIAAPSLHLPKPPSLGTTEFPSGKARSFSPASFEIETHRRPEAFVTSPAQKFLDDYGHEVHAVRQEFIRFRTATPGERASHLSQLLGTLSRLNSEAAGAGFAGLARYLTVLEWRSQQLLDTLGAASPASLQGLATAVDVLAAMSNHLAELQPLNHLSPHAMVVDDENVSRKALCLGLEKAKIKTSGVDNPTSALLEAESKPFDLIYLDVDLPKMNGFALCARIRIIPAHRKTPIIFVTSLNDVKSRASSRVSGGNDFLTKPVNLSEVGINAWSLMIGKRVLDNGPKPRA